MKPRRQFWISASFGAFALAGFLMGAVSIALNAVSFSAIGRLRTSEPPPHFRWSQVESADRDVFASNLRAIGCPEQTIAMLVNARATAASPAPGGALVHSGALSSSSTVRSIRAAESAGAEPSASTLRPAFASAQGNMATVSGNTLVVSESMGTAVSAEAPAPANATDQSLSSTTTAGNRKSFPVGVYSTMRVAGVRAGAVPSAGIGGGASSVAGDEVITAPDDKVAVPVAFQDPGPSEKPSADQLAKVDQIQQQFIDDIHSADGSAPDAARWQTAQQKSDALFRALYGYQAYLNRQMQENLHRD